MTTASAVPVISILLACLVKASLSCNGYSLKTNSIKNCGADNVIRIDNFDVTLDKDCNVIPKGCVTITQSFNTAEVHITLDKPPMPQISGVLDLCKLVSQRQSIAHILTDFSIPNKCPVQAQKICVDGTKTHNISKFKNQLGLMAGNITFKAEAKHDTGTSCIEASGLLQKGSG